VRGGWGVAYAAIGDRQSARKVMAQLEGPVFDTLMGEPRFRALVAALGL